MRQINIFNKNGKYSWKQNSFTESIPSSNRSGLLPQDVDAPLHSNTSELKNPFVIPGIKNLQIESQLNPNYNFDNF